MSFLEWLMPLAALAIVPLGLAVWGIGGKWLAGSIVSAGFVILAALSELGWVSMGLAAPWVVWMLVIAFQGRRHVAFAYLALGAVAFGCGRLEGRPLGVRDEMLLLWAMHFLYAGWAGLTLLEGLGRIWEQVPGTRIWQVAWWLLAVGPLVQAVGMLVAPQVEFGGAMAMAVGAVLAPGIGLGWGVIRPVDARVRICFSAAAAAAVVAMGVGALYAARHVGEAYWVGLPQLATVHGAASALGLALFSLAGCVLGQRLPGLVRESR